MAHAYSNLFKIPSTGMRLFTVYGPWGRPDMAPMIFTKAILSSEPIKIFNNGEMYRDFTYIDDVTDAILKLLNIPPSFLNDKTNEKNSSSNISIPYRVINIGNSTSIKIMEFIEILEKELGKKAIKKFEEMQLGDVKKTYADITYIKNLINYQPSTSIRKGVKDFIKWYKDFYKF